MQPLPAGEEEHRDDCRSDGYPLGQRQRDRPKKIGVDIQHEHHQADTRLAFLVARLDVLTIENEEPGPEHHESTGEREKVSRIEEVQHTPARLSMGNVRMPRGRVVPAWAKNSSKARRRKKLKPMSKARFVADGVPVIGMAPAKS
jgi:hypothetical protein